MYRTAYVELNGTHEILSLSKTADEKVFTYKNVDFFPHAVMSTLTEILNMRYERVIIDFGILNPNTLKEFMRCDVRIAVCTISKWNRGALNRIIELFNSNKITDSESVKILFNLVEKKKTINHKHFKYPVVGFPYLEDRSSSIPACLALWIRYQKGINITMQNDIFNQLFINFMSEAFGGLILLMPQSAS